MQVFSSTFIGIIHPGASLVVTWEYNLVRALVFTIEALCGRRKRARSPARPAGFVCKDPLTSPLVLSQINLAVSLCGYYLAFLLIDNKFYGRRNMQQVGFAFDFFIYLFAAIVRFVSSFSFPAYLADSPCACTVLQRVASQRRTDRCVPVHVPLLVVLEPVRVRPVAPLLHTCSY